ncbi:hypothetical protein HG535_0B00870 [Zygotorulaspora mrakii]|uniref:Alpha-1,3/1,6-mannosyltransferase ALG2 n=1 Tax=Zygotorulaspora mrakii TaxID=42260 RepID=A0A7H9AZC4_ZYGMR|nr:uncharacterized protein HG535_0B00870 [Zygotorulaspora mrakii]QLG71049.1 hypothetical protein HG535_0B00870 [Zygotorulaspora mrakii]
MTELKRKLRIAFIHPDLGIGGAERLVVDAAVGLQEQGQDVTIYTSHCDKSHCFEEVRNGTLKVKVYGDGLPTNVGGRFFIVFANLRQLYLVMKLVLTREIMRYDLFIIDQLSTCLPFLHMLGNAKTLFYCHFPDQLLAIRSSFIKKLYRVSFDIMEQFTMSAADCVVVNSNFTKTVYQKTFTYLKGKVNVVYPCVDLTFGPIQDKDKELAEVLLNTRDKFYLSVNRYERKKNIELALKAFALSEEMNNPHAKLIICGGYDGRVVENVEYLKHLHKISDTLQLSYATIFYPEISNLKDLQTSDTATKKVIFLTSISTSLKDLLLSKTELLLYTPSFEHFGIVPLEAMKYGKPVIAVNTGGPLETVEPLIKGKTENIATGWLKTADPEEWSNAINEFKNVRDQKVVVFSETGPKRVRKLFSREAMTNSFVENIKTFIDSKRTSYIWEKLLIVLFNLLLQVIMSRIFIVKPWTYLLLAVTSTLCFRNIGTGLYWLAVYLSISILLRGVSSII